MKKYVMLFLVLLLTLVMMFGCNKQTDTKGKEGNNTESKVVDGKFDPPVTITTGRGLNTGDVKFKNGEDIHNNVHNKWAKEELGIDIKYDWIVADEGDQFNNKIRLSLSANEPLPDVMIIGDRQLASDLIESGLVQPIDEAIEKYATPRIKKLFEDFPQGFSTTTVDGKRYGVPRYSGGNGSDSVLWIRQDWLDKLNLKGPETLEDVEKIMDAFVHQDPDGNGKDDTIGVTLAMKYNLATWMADGSWIFGAYGDYLPKLWSKDEDGNLVYGSIQPSIKQGLAKLNEWFEKGYLDREVGILDEEKAIESFVAGKSGIAAAPPWAADWPLPDLLANNPGAVVKAYPMPSGPDGNIGRYGEGYLTGAFLFNKDFKHLDAFFKYYDAIYGYLLGESEYFENGMHEGYDYVMKDGKPVYDKDEIPDGWVNPGKYNLLGDIPDAPFLMYDLLKQFHRGEKEPQTAYEHILVARGELWLESAAIVTDQNEHRIENLFTGPPTKTQTAKGEFLSKMQDKTFSEIVYGKAPLSDFDKFVEKWKAGGGDKITEEVNEWYKSVNGE
ncbi:extracellular solute-binding protein [Bacillus sp. IITD106]|nr:extracellular solute-binding protein [Bacillus sp. IITD106]